MVEKEMPGIIRKDVAFIVRKPDRAKNIAVRFHITPKLLVQLNRPLRKKQIMYAGKKLVIPVWLKRKKTGHEDSDFNLADYELDMDSLDYYVREDFVCMAEIEADTVRRLAIDKEIKKIDKRIEEVNSILDSIEEDGMHNLSMRDIRKMPMARARRTGMFKIGAQIDSLSRVRDQISQERSKIDLRLADYEYLVENAGYMASHTSVEDIKPILLQEWTGPDKVSTTKDKTNK